MVLFMGLDRVLVHLIAILRRTGEYFTYTTGTSIMVGGKPGNASGKPIGWQRLRIQSIAEI